MVQIHRQKGNLRGNIAVSKPVIKFNTVIDADAITEANVGGVKVTMTIPDPAIGYPPVKQGYFLYNKASGIGFNMPILLWRNGIANVFLGLAKVFFSIFGDGIKAAKGTDTAPTMTVGGSG